MSIRRCHAIHPPVTRHETNNIIGFTLASLSISQRLFGIFVHLCFVALLPSTTCCLTRRWSVANSIAVIPFRPIWGRLQYMSPLLLMCPVGVLRFLFYWIHHQRLCFSSSRFSTLGQRIFATLSSPTSLQPCSSGDAITLRAVKVNITCN